MRRVLEAVLLLLLIVSGAAAQSQPAPQPREPQKKATAGKHQPNPDQRGTENTPLIVKVLPSEQAEQKTAGGSAANHDQPKEQWGLSDKIAAVAIIVGSLQFVALLATVWVMRRTAERQLRAYIGVRVIQHPEVGPIEESPRIVEMPQIRIEIQNYGQTPAYSVSHWTSIDVHSYPCPFELPDVKAPANQRPASQPLPPTGTIIVSISPLNPIPAALRNVIECADTQRLYVWGAVTYLDAFKRHRYTKFRFMYGGEDITSIGTMHWCEVGNEAI